MTVENPSPARRQGLFHRRFLPSPSRRYGYLLAGLVALNFIARAVRMGTDRPLWDDEAMLVLNFFTRGYAGLLRPLLWAQLAPPGFLWLTRATAEVLGYREWALRLWPALAGTLATVLFVPLARRVARPREALLAVGVFASSFYPLRHSTEVKPYSIDLLFSVTILLLAWSIGHGGLRRPKLAWATFTVVGAAGAWLSFPSIFVSGAATLWLLLGCLRAADPPRRGAAVAAVVSGAIVVASFACMYASFHAVVTANSQEYREMEMWAWAFPPTGRPWLIPWWLLDVHAGRMLAYPQGDNYFGSSITLLLVLVGGWTLWNGRGRRRRLLSLCLLVPAFGLLAAFLGLYPYGRTARTMLYAAPPIILLEGIGAWALLRLLPRRRTPTSAAAPCASSSCETDPTTTRPCGPVKARCGCSNVAGRTPTRSFALSASGRVQSWSSGGSRPKPRPPARHRRLRRYRIRENDRDHPTHYPSPYPATGAVVRLRLWRLRGDRP